jgi:FkbM family methyltransferase
VFEQVFFDLQYDLPVRSDLVWIVDGGAHAGYSALRFANLFPSARIIAVEPERGNVELLRENTAAYPNIEVVDGALWPTAELLDVINPDAQNWGYRVGIAGAGTVQGYTLEEILDRLPNGPGLVKLDIEGAEREVLLDAERWIDRADYLFVAFHDEVAPGASASLDVAVGSRASRRSTHDEGTLVTFERARPSTMPRCQPPHSSPPACGAPRPTSSSPSTAASGSPSTRM